MMRQTSRRWRDDDDSELYGVLTALMMPGAYRVHLLGQSLPFATDRQLNYSITRTTATCGCELLCATCIFNSYALDSRRLGGLTLQ